MTSDATWLRAHLREVLDFPPAGISFKDITPLLASVDAFRFTVDAIADAWTGAGVSHVAGIEARGFLLAAPVAYRLGASFVPVRKAGKLPWAVVREEYQLEYGSDRLEIHRDAIRPDERILIVDDVLATGGTAAATCRLVEALGGSIVGIGILIELSALDGRSALGDRRLEALASY